MLDTIVVDGDMLVFEPMFGHRIVTVPSPVKINGSGMCTVGGKRVCVVGDEMRLQINALYNAPPFVGGQGKIVVTLMPNQMTPLVSSGRPLIVKGQKFMAMFTLTDPAKNSLPPPAPAFDLMLAPTPGFGSFITTQFIAKAG